MAGKTATLKIPGKEIQLPIVTSIGNVQSLDAGSFHEKTGMYFYDPSLNNTAVSNSKITLIDSENDKLYYRGYDVEELVDKSGFIETAYLLYHGELPTKTELEKYSSLLSNHSLIHESMKNFYDAFPGDAHPLAILATMVTALSSYYPQSYEESRAMGVDVTIRLLAKVRTLAAWSYKKSIGHPVIYPRDELPYWTNLLNMMFAVPIESYHVDPQDDAIMNRLMLLYCDHEQNIATSTVRLLASTQANLFVCINAGISAFWGAREAAYDVLTVPMIEYMIDNGLSPEKYFENFVNGIEKLRSPAFGHAKYKERDPRANISRRLFQEYLQRKCPDGKYDIFIQKALEVEEYTLSHVAFKERNLYPNLDFYSALIFHLVGIPDNMANVIRVIGKLPGWLAHWREQRLDRDVKSMRPQQIYNGSAPRPFVPIEARPTEAR